MSKKTRIDVRFMLHLPMKRLGGCIVPPEEAISNWQLAKAKATVIHHGRGGRRKRGLWLLFARQIGRGVVDLAAADFVHLIFEGCSVIALCVGQSPGLAFVIPALGIQALRFFEVGDGFSCVATLIELFS